jgi:hypothetical protein
LKLVGEEFAKIGVVVDDQDGLALSHGLEHAPFEGPPQRGLLMRRRRPLR